MTNSKQNKSISVLGIDLGKHKFQLCGLSKHGVKVLDKEVNRSQLINVLSTIKSCLVGLESCGSSHYWARLFRSYGHDVKLIAPQFVKPYIKSNKNDRIDAEAICEAIQRPNMRFVAIKEVAQQDIQALHRVRSRAVANRTALTNQLQGLLLEYGIVLPVGRKKIRREIPTLLEEAENGLTSRFRFLLSDLYQELCHLDERIEALDQQVNQVITEDDRIKRLITIPGIGPLGASALMAAVGSVSVFRNGREMAAWLGLVPRQYSTGGKPRLLGISKRGDVYLRQLLIHGARSALRVVDKKSDHRSRWARDIISKRNKNIAAVAMANKMVRTAYALLKHGGVYQAEPQY